MVRLLCLDDEESNEPPEASAHRPSAVVEQDGDDGRPNPNINGFSAALSCYPIVSQLASLLDLNSLHGLSRTCRQFRANLLQYRKMLIAQTLRCENESTSIGAKLGEALTASFQTWTSYGREGRKVDRLTSGKVGACASDMVGQCRKCGKIVCRNCIVKPPPPATLRGRQRRLCRTCTKAPIGKLTSFVPNEDRPESDQDTFTAPAFARPPCNCHETVWICQPCGQSLRTNDTTYARGWAWRSRYSTCGGIGAGLGEGNEGVECGRLSDCLAATDIYKELECGGDELADIEAQLSRAQEDGHTWLGTSYTTQEIVGIGGRVKKKVKKRVWVGQAVKEYEDEKGTGTPLLREQSGANRSWCSWCARVVPGKKDSEGAGKSMESVVSSSSGSSL